MMGKRRFQNDVISRGGMILSDGTLLTSDLVLSAYLLINDYGLRPNFYDELDMLIGDELIDFGHFHSILDMDTELGNQASWLWHEEIFDYFNDIAPEGYYFGSHEGDGALIGWFAMEDVQ